jgi:hypothetical protein
LLYNEIGYEFSNGKIHENLTLGGQTQENEYEYRSVNIFTEPGCRIIYSFSKLINVGLYAGYLFDTHSSIKSSETAISRKEFYDVSNGESSVNWTGIRFGVSISYTFRDGTL